MDHQEGTCYLGLYIMLDRNTILMEQHLWKKANTLYYCIPAYAHEPP